MDLQNLFFFSAVAGCLVLAVIVFAIMACKPALRITPAPLILAITILAVWAYTFFTWDGTDFISNISAAGFAVPLLAALPLVILNFWPLKIWWRALLMLVLALGAIIGTNLQFPFFEGISPLTLQISAAVLWTVIGLSLRLLNIVPLLAVSQLLCTCIGMLLLAFIGALPLALGTEAGCLGAILLGFILCNHYLVRLNLSDTDADILGFMLGGLFTLGSAEGCAAPLSIFQLLLFGEVIFAAVKKATCLPQYADIKANTACAMALASGLGEQSVLNYTYRLNILMILLGSFQVYSPNQTSIPLICAAFIGWQMYRLIHWQNLSSSLAETNKSAASGLKQNYRDFKKNLKKIKSKPQDDSK